QIREEYFHRDISASPRYRVPRRYWQILLQCSPRPGLEFAWATWQDGKPHLKRLRIRCPEFSDRNAATPRSKSESSQRAHERRSPDARCAHLRERRGSLRG